MPSSYVAPVQSVNGKTGAVNLEAVDVNALPAGTRIPSKTSDLTNDSGFITASQVPSAPVQSVNTKTGAVVLSASDVGAMPSSYVAPVTSVNGQTGAVVLDAEDVGALPADTPIPAAVTEQTVAGWGFTKNTGTYTKPASGIPASDLASGVIPTVPITGVSVNGTVLTPQDGVVDVEVPTDYVNTDDFEDRTGSMRIVLSYSNGVVALGQSGTTLDRLIAALLNSCNVWFLLPTAYITGIPSNTDMMLFWMTGANLDTSAPTISLTSVYNGNVYHAVLSPVSEYRMEGQLQVLDYQTAQDVQTAIAEAAELPTGGSTGDFLRKTASGVAWETVQTWQGGSY